MNIADVVIAILRIKYIDKVIKSELHSQIQPKVNFSLQFRLIIFNTILITLFQIEGSLPKNIFVREILNLFKGERRAAGILLAKNVVSLFPTFFL